MTLSKPIATDPELLNLLERFRDYEMSPAEICAQKLSWCIGELGFSYPEMSREERERLCQEAMKKQGYDL